MWNRKAKKVLDELQHRCEMYKVNVFNHLCAENISDSDREELAGEMWAFDQVLYEIMELSYRLKRGEKDE